MRSARKIVTVIQARTGSTRFPEKVLMPLSGKSLLIRLVDRVKRAKLTGKIVIAITDYADDDVISEICSRENLNVFRGNPTDLLDRHFKAGVAYGAEHLVKIPSDCPLIDPQIIDKVINHYLEHSNYDYVSNLHPATYPDGNDVEIMSMKALKIAWKNAAKQLEREHTTPYFWENPELFSCGNIIWENGLDYSMTHRWTIDYPEDYEFINKVYEALFNDNPQFGLYDVLDLLKKKPELKKINSEYAGVNWYGKHLDQLRTVDSKQTKIIE